MNKQNNKLVKLHLFLTQAVAEQTLTYQNNDKIIKVGDFPKSYRFNKFLYSLDELNAMSSIYRIEMNGIEVIAKKAELMQLCHDFVYMKIIEIVLPNKDSETFDMTKRFVDESLYLEEDINLFKQFTEKILKLSAIEVLRYNITLFYKNLIKNLFYFLTDKIFNKELTQLLNDIIHKKVSTGDEITNYFSDKETVNGFIMILGLLGLPFSVTISNGKIYLSQELKEFVFVLLVALIANSFHTDDSKNNLMYLLIHSFTSNDDKLI